MLLHNLLQFSFCSYQETHNDDGPVNRVNMLSEDGITMKVQLVQKYDASSNFMKLFEEKLVTSLITSNISFSFVETEAFRDLITTLDPRICLLSRKTLDNHVRDFVTKQVSISFVCSICFKKNNSINTILHCNVIRCSILLLCIVFVFTL